MTKLTPGQKRLLLEMATDQRVLLIQRHPRKFMALRYTINSFPMRHLQHQMVAKLARLGYLKISTRGYYVLTNKGMLAASRHKQMVERRRHE